MLFSTEQAIEEIRPLNPVVTWSLDTLSDLNLTTLFTLYPTCFLEPSTLNASDYVSRWITPNGQIITLTNSSFVNVSFVNNSIMLTVNFEQFRVFQGRVNTDQGERQSTLYFFGRNLTYQDAGTYTCEVRSSSAPAQSPWLSASVEVELEGKDTCG